MLVKNIKLANDVGKFAKFPRTEGRLKEQYIKIKTTIQTCW